MIKDNTNASMKLPKDINIIPTDINTTNTLESNNAIVNASMSSAVTPIKIKIVLGLILGLLICTAIAIPLGISLNRKNEIEITKFNATAFDIDTSNEPETSFESSVLETIDKAQSTEIDNTSSDSKSALDTKGTTDKKENLGNEEKEEEEEEEVKSIDNTAEKGTINTQEKKEKEEIKSDENPIINPPNEEEKENEKEPIQDDKKYSYFIATYSSQTNKETKAFNVMAIHLKDDEYSMKYLEEDETENPNDQSPTRNLLESENELNITNFNQGFFESPKEGFIKLKVYFYVPIPSLDFLFFDCGDLINVDLSNLNTTDMTRISYTFYNCKNLEEVNMTSIDTSNVEYMEFLFAGCENLMNIIGIENLNTSSVKYTTGMFFDCKNIQNVNVSSFDLDNLEEPDGMFVNTQSLRVVDLGNTTNANNLFDTREEYNLIIIGNTDINISQLSGNINIYNITEINNLTELTQSIPCITGEGEKCAYCSIVEDESHCGGCNEGFKKKMQKM